MAMLSFDSADEEANEAQRWADALGLDLGALLRQALHRHLAALRAEGDVARWAVSPNRAAPDPLRLIADWGQAEDWSDWVDAAR
jgi:hypothetical protein